MASLAAIFLALVCSSQESLDPRITWFFQVESCQPCLQKQLEVMDTYYRDEDLVVVYFQSETESKKINAIRNEIKARMPMARIRFESGERLATGWIFEDHLTGETVTFESRKGDYNSWRAQAILNTIR